ncbi:MAG: RidA family protein [Rhodothermales bacterium]|nr:RidA family protein [Rhodothermales bacterium]MBO6780033.1 RidA family protein [Rhodothermales bacterium]
MKRLIPLLSVFVLVGCAAPQAQDAPEPDVEYYPFGGSAPLSEAVRVGDMIYLSGKLGLSRDGEQGIQAETRRTMEAIKSSLEEKGSSMAHVVKCTVFLADMAEWGAMNEIYREYFPENPPARSAVGVNGMAGNARVEIECMATTGS